MKKIILLLIFIWFLWYLYHLWLKNWKIEQAKNSLTNNEQVLNNNAHQEDINNNLKTQAKNTKKDNTHTGTTKDLFNKVGITYDKKLIWTEDNWVFFWLPQSELFWEALSLDWWKITYSKIDNLIIEKKEFDKSQVSDSQNIWNRAGTWYLNDNYDSYIYWNTLRNVDNNNKDAWVSFYVLEKKEDKFVYQKLYFDFNHWLIWTLQIKEFDVNKDKNIWTQMQELNTKLKEQNKDFEVVKKTDFLFKEIVR